MAKLSIVAGATSQSVNVFIQNSSLTTGAGLTGLAYNTASLTAYYTFTGANTTATAITLGSLAAVTSAYSSGGFKEVDATNMPGVYRLDIPNAALAASKGRSVAIMLKGATNMSPCLLEIELTGWDNQDAVHGGLSCLPNTAVTTNGSLITSGSSTAQLNVSSGNIAGSVASVVGNVGGNVTGSVGSVTAAVTLGTVNSSASNIKKNTALSAFPFLMTDSTTHAPKTGVTVTATRSIDGAAFAACANSVTETGNGWYQINLAAADLNGNTIALRFTGTSSDDRDITIITQP